MIYPSAGGLGAQSYAMWPGVPMMIVRKQGCQATGGQCSLCDGLALVLDLILPISLELIKPRDHNYREWTMGFCVTGYSPKALWKKNDVWCLQSFPYSDLKDCYAAQG